MSSERKFRPLYYKIQDDIKSLIKHRRLETGDKIPSERELGELYNASRSSIRKAIRDLIYEGVLSRIPGKGTFVSGDTNSFPPASYKTGNIGFAVFFSSIDRKRTDITDTTAENESTSPSIPFYSDVFEGANRELEKSGMHLLFFTGYQDAPTEVYRFKEFLKKIDGVIVCELATLKLANIFEKSRLPAVLISPSIDSHPVKLDALLIDNRDGAYQATSYLIELGHRNIGLINHPTTHNVPATERLRGYKLALKRAGIEFDSARIEEGDWSMHSGYFAMKRLMERKKDSTAIFATNDEMAVGAMKAIKEEGLRIPEDISVVGFDDSSLSTNTFISLTTIRVHRREMGRYAAQRLIQKTNEPTFIPIKVTFPTQIIKRGTTAPVTRYSDVNDR